MGKIMCLFLTFFLEWLNLFSGNILKNFSYEILVRLRGTSSAQEQAGEYI